ncbi:polysaccharide deacetylase family protein [Allostreptomyces psammosilenae]|uniref:Peptidoglycan/xylan/chitin deacetylase (PgdA/CDA1 family) n=1 Tax=Allostreptomyces psammosilenae TaxID=1892865 RepID=A0A853A1Y4_9ACTN|nr:polysaccharide deacetylase family protein [Allostreptomyces psammosilenae]NYI07470.1 peptidoglycan/xylan/chitin deacetylase (PgdA/CDA1 family) [Allostreptomyces psammosilenae]
MAATARPSDALRAGVKRGLARMPRARSGAPSGATVLIYHRVGGDSPDELDVTVADFTAQLDVLAALGTGPGGVVGLDAAVDRLRRGDPTGSTVITFDDGFADLYRHAWPRLRERGLPFTVYLTAGRVGTTMSWPGSTATATAAPALTWEQLAEMVGSGLCEVANHTLSHPRPELLTSTELDACDELIHRHLGVRTRHFAYTWGVPVPRMEAALRARYRTAATGAVGRNRPGGDPMRLHRVPVRRTDPLDFFRAKLAGGLLPERLYAGIVRTAKAVGARA